MSFGVPVAPIVLRSTSAVSANGIKVLVYGNSGTGKTRLMATVPSPVILSAESGLLSLRKFNLPYIEIHNMGELSQAFQWIMGSNEARQFATICVDSASEIGEVCLKGELSTNKDGRKAYGEFGTKMISAIRDFRDIPGKNVVITAKQEWAKDDSNGMMMFAPSMPGSKVGPAIPYYFDEVFQQCVFSDPQTKERKEWLRTRADAQNIAKDRSGALAEWEAPNLSAIFAKIIGG